MHMLTCCSYLRARDLRGRDVDWVTSTQPIVSTNDGCLRGTPSHADVGVLYVQCAQRGQCGQCACMCLGIAVFSNRDF